MKPSRNNDLADKEANRARIEAEPFGLMSRMLAGEESVRLELKTKSVIGPYREAMLKVRCEDRLANLVGPKYTHQGILARESGNRFLGLLSVTRHTHNPLLIRFMMLAMLEWLPVERRLWMKSQQGDNAGRGQYCKLCKATKETNRHALLECPHEDVVKVKDWGIEVC